MLSGKKIRPNESASSKNIKPKKLIIYQIGYKVAILNIFYTRKGVFLKAQIFGKTDQGKSKSVMKINIWDTFSHFRISL